MDRKEFIRTCGFSCLAWVGVSLLQSCTGTKYIQTASENNTIKIARSEFIEIKNEKQKIRRYIIVKVNTLNFPVVLYRNTDTDFAALLLRCPHQGAELNVNGDLISCPAHGSEFNNKGMLVQGPAEQDLQQYTVTSDKEYIYIQLI